MIYKLLLFCGLITTLTYAPIYTQATETGMFDIVKDFAENKKVNEQSTEILVKGKDIKDIYDSKAEYYSNNINNDLGAVKPVKPDISRPSPDKYPNQDKYFAGTTDFTKLSIAEKDTSLYNWSAIRKEYDKFDDQGSDNVKIIATAYTSAAEENGGYEGMNAIGGSLGAGCIASPKDIPFQTKIRISGLGVFNVEDRGSAIVRVSEDVIRVDVWMNSYREAMKFGKRVYMGRIIEGD